MKQKHLRVVDRVNVNRLAIIEHQLDKSLTKLEFLRNETDIEEQNVLTFIRLQRLIKQKLNYKN
jgi:hypothetical protein